MPSSEARILKERWSYCRRRSHSSFLCFRRFSLLMNAIQKYFPKQRLKKERVEGMFLPMLKREFEYKGERFVVKITPAKLEMREGERDFYPSHREELVEEALRKIASTRLNGIFLNDPSKG